MSEISSERSGSGTGTGSGSGSGDDTKRACKVDFSTTCPMCQVEMQPVHSHYQCMRCGWRDSCCF